MSAYTSQDSKTCFGRFKVLTLEYFELKPVMEMPGFKWNEKQTLITASDDTWNALPDVSTVTS